MQKPVVIAIAVFAACVIAVVICSLIVNSQEDASSSLATSDYRSCSSTEKNSPFGKYSTAAMSADADQCAVIAKNVLSQGGNTVDAAIAAMFCVGIKNAQSCGLGGGFVATYYSKSQNQVFALDAREVAPLAAYPDMYNPQINTQLKNTTGKWWEEKPSASLKGGLSAAVPGEAAGLYELYQKFGGKLPWRDLIEPSIQICETGYNLTWYTGGVNERVGADILSESSMELFTNTEEKRALHEGEFVQRLQLAKTLRALQGDPRALQVGPLAEKLVEDIQSYGGIITKEDLAQYKPKWREAVKFDLEHGNFSLYSFPPPGSGLLVGLIMNILDEYKLTEQNLTPPQMDRTQQIVAEAMKYAFARRYQIGDLNDADIKKVIDEITSDALAAAIKDKMLLTSTKQDASYYGAHTVGPSDHGTAHFSIIGPDGDALAITSSINHAYGAGVRSQQTGIIINNQMDDFSSPDSFKEEGTVAMTNNVIKPGKRPLTSMSPTIVLDAARNVRLCIGAAGGPQIPTAIAWVSARNLWMGQDLREAVDSCRSHHQLQPMLLQYEAGFPETWLTSLEAKGHLTKPNQWKSVAGAVARDHNGSLVANADFRKSGEVQGL